MQLAYGGADLDDVVSFHGSLPPATGLAPGSIKPSILIAHGEADSFIPPERITAFKEGRGAAQADWPMVIYAGARHSHTHRGASDYGLEAHGHDKKADLRSSAHMQSFLNEVFAD
jgi:dienelactone hydrolase